MGRRSERARAPALQAALWLAAVTLLLAGCTPVQPWVKPYEREHLADPIMSLSRNSVSATYLDHMFETREGSHGATGAVGGGCGCN
ncbi:MAG: DUF4266 domain-containing protein [Steroidobacteraceae bacterium]